MKRYSASRRRRRVYERRFDWIEARARHAAGETIASIARALGVDRRGVARVLRLPEYRVEEATDDQVRIAFTYRDRVPCPRCSHPKMPKAELCASCRNEMRLEPMTVGKIPGTPGTTRIELRDVEVGRIVEMDGDYGILVKSPNGPTPPRYRVVDFWFDGPMLVHERVRVAVLPATEVLVGGVPTIGEEIEQ